MSLYLVGNMTLSVHECLIEEELSYYIYIFVPVKYTVACLYNRNWLTIQHLLYGRNYSYIILFFIYNNLTVWVSISIRKKNK